jgi:hypothetical protein
MKKKLADLLEKLGITLKNKKTNEIEMTVTGSLAELDDIAAELSENEKFDPKQVDQIMEKILSLDWVEKDLANSIQPVYVIKSDNPTNWLFSVSKKTFCNINNNSEIISIDKATENTSYCFINNDYFEVDNELIFCLGWN